MSSIIDAWINRPTRILCIGNKSLGVDVTNTVDYAKQKGLKIKVLFSGKLIKVYK